jgi:hypothetical protein
MFAPGQNLRFKGISSRIAISKQNTFLGQFHSHG